VRDLDLAERAGLRVPRDVRRTIKSAIADGAISSPGDGVGASPATPPGGALAWWQAEAVAQPNGGAQTVRVYYLNEAAALVILMRLRTKVAVEVTRAVVRVFMAARRGAVAPPAPAAPFAPTGGLEAYRAGVAALERARAADAIDDKGLAVRQAQLLERHLGVDILSAPTRGFEALPEVASLKPGESLIIKRKTNTSGHVSASAVGRPYHLSGQFVGKKAREFGVFGREEWGMWRAFDAEDGSGSIDHWLYNDKAVALLAPHLEEEVARRKAEAERKAPRPKRLGGQAPLALVATPPSAAPAAGPTGRGAA
jgi:hypothetical protein